jgi:hypothetical protein
LIVDTNANGAVNEFPNGDNNTFVRSIYINPEPPADLVTSDVVAPTQVFDGTKIDVSYHVDNLGLEPTDQTNWTDTIWLTRDQTRPNVTKGDVLLATLPHSGVIGNDPTVISPPTGYDVTATVTLPKHISGQFYITAWSDSFDVVHKSTQDANINPNDPNQLNSDNYKATPITVLLTPPPDLVVTAVTPQQAAVGGDDFAVTWTVQNQGNSPTEDSVLFDQIYLSDKPTFIPPTPARTSGISGTLGAWNMTAPSPPTPVTPARRRSSCRRKSPAAMSSWSRTPASIPSLQPGKDPTPTIISALALRTSPRSRRQT